MSARRGGRLALWTLTAVLALGESARGDAPPRDGSPAPGRGELTLSVALPGAGLEYARYYSDGFAAGLGLEWEVLSRGNDLLLIAIGLRAPLRLRRGVVVLDIAPGVRRFSGNRNDAACGCQIDLPSTLALQAPASATVLMPLGDQVRAGLRVVIGADLLFAPAGAASTRMGWLLAPQVGPQVELRLAGSFALGFGAHLGRLYGVTPGFRYTLLGPATTQAAIPLVVEMSAAFSL